MMIRIANSHHHACMIHPNVYPVELATTSYGYAKRTEFLLITGCGLRLLSLTSFSKIIVFIQQSHDYLMGPLTIPRDSQGD